MGRVGMRSRRIQHHIAGQPPIPHAGEGYNYCCVSYINTVVDANVDTKPAHLPPVVPQTYFTYLGASENKKLEKTRGCAGVQPGT